MYFVPPATSAATVTPTSSPSTVTTLSAGGAGQVTDAARLLQVAASVSSLALQLSSFNDGADGGVASTSTGTGNWLSQQERSDLDALFANPFTAF